jgi:hypothetical protein
VTRSRPLGTTAALVGALVCGIALSVVKGDGDGVRSAIGNLSGPWLLIPLVAGASTRASRVTGLRHVGWGAVFGLLVTLAALGGFYASNSLVLDLGPHAWLVDLRLSVAAGRRYFLLGLLSGPVCGAFGAWWTARDARSLAGPVAALLVLEPVASWVQQAAVGGDHTGQPGVWAGELLLGVGVGAWAATRGRRELEPAARAPEAYPKRSPLV